jgi:transcriptional regulator with XRE-family HTH domain
MMYDMTMTESQEVKTTGIVPGRIAELLQKRGMTAAELARQTGLSKSAISLIMADKRHATTALNVAAIARVLHVSVDYLLGLTNDPQPSPMMLGDLPLELARMAKQLPSRRQRDLLAMARTYLEMHNERDLDALMSDLLDLVAEYAGVESRDRLIDFLEREGKAKGYLTDYDEVD